MSKIAINNLEFRYPDNTFRLIIPQLEIESGARVALIGPSGTGKTTLLNLIAGISMPEQGEINVNGKCINSLSDAARRAYRISQIGMVFQNFELLEYLSVLDNILQPYRIHPALQLDGSVRDRAQQLAQETGLEDKLFRFPAKLSHGERQRAAICRALMNKPKLILADEPTGNLDPANKQRIMQLLFEQATAHNATLLVVTHDHGLLDQFSRVVDMESLLESIT